MSRNWFDSDIPEAREILRIFLDNGPEMDNARELIERVGDDPDKAKKTIAFLAAMAGSVIETLGVNVEEVFAAITLLKEQLGAEFDG